MSDFPIPKDKMIECWEYRAKDNALFWTWSNRVSEKDYFKSGIDWIEKQVKQHLPLKKELCLEIGSGCGRLTFPLAKCFTKVIGIDICEGMIKKANSFKEKFSVDNIKFKNSTNIDKSLKVDFVFTYTVFQHCEFDIWMKYVKDCYEILNTGGRFYLHAYIPTNQENIIKLITEIGYKVIHTEPEGDCIIIILEK